MRKRLTLLDCVALGVNGIIGSGIFFVPKWVAGGAGSLGPLAFVACGALCALVALCYAEVSGMFDRSGGTYLYAREAFGETVGFGVGWIALVSTLLGYATIARYLGDEIARVASLPPMPSALPVPTGAVVGGSVVLLLGVANWRGVRAGALTSDLLTILKLAALVLFVAVGLFFVSGERMAALGWPSPGGFAEGMFSALFAVSGFEFVAIVAGEAEDPRRAIPRAILVSLVGSVVLYVFIQLVVGGTLDGLARSEAPLVEAARAFGGGGMAGLIRFAAIASMIGFCSSSALIGPQFIATLAKDGILPGVVARRHAVRDVPEVAVGLVTLLTVALVASLDFQKLADLTVVTLFCQYAPTVLSVVVFRARRPGAERGFRVPFGPVLPLVALAVMVVLVAKKVEVRNLEFFVAVMLVGYLYFGTRWLVGRGGGGPAPAGGGPG